VTRQDRTPAGGHGFSEVVAAAWAPAGAGRLSRAAIDRTIPGSGCGALSRELAANDWQDRTDARRGGLQDRNVELLVPAPFASGSQVQPSAGRILTSTSG